MIINNEIYIDKINIKTILLLKNINQLIHENLFNYNFDIQNICNISNPVLNISLSCNSTYFHFIANTLPYLITYMNNNPEYNFEIYIETNKFNYILDLLFDYKFKINSQDQIIKCDNLIIPKIFDFNNQFGWNKYNITNNQDIYNFVPEQLILTRNYILNKLQITKNKDLRLFIVRDTNFRKSTFIENKKLIEIFENLNFKFISLDNIDFKEQIDIFYNAEIVISEPGSCCANIMFMRENTNYIIITKNCKYTSNNFFPTFAEIFKVNCYNLLTKPKYNINDEELNINNFNHIKNIGLSNHPMNSTTIINEQILIELENYVKQIIIK